MNSARRPPVWMMVKEALSSLGGRASRRQIARWIARCYPGTKPVTVSCQMTICTVNNPVRVQFTQNGRPRTKRARYDFLFETSDGTLVWYSPARHGHWIIARGANKRLIVRRLRTSAECGVRPSRLRILFCGAPSENKDYAILSNIEERGGHSNWSSLKTAAAGDRVLFYTVQERQAFVASGWVLRDTKPTNDPRDHYRYRSWIGAARLLANPVRISDVRGHFPEWGWPRFTRNVTTVPKTIEAELWRFIHEQGQALPQPDPKAHNRSNGTGNRGAGFGDPESNKLVELAAIRAAKRELRRQHYKVRSREKENIGYDLDATRGNETLHVEVKGISGDAAAFSISRNEVATARCDPLSRVMLVNRARSRRPRITMFFGHELDAKFNLEPTGFAATKRPGAS